MQLINKLDFKNKEEVQIIEEAFEDREDYFWNIKILEILKNKIDSINWSDYIVVSDLDGTLIDKLGMAPWVNVFFSYIDCPAFIATGRSTSTLVGFIKDFANYSGRNIFEGGVCENGGLILFKDDQWSTENLVKKSKEPLETFIETTELDLKDYPVVYSDTRQTDVILTISQDIEDKVNSWNQYLFNKKIPYKLTMATNSTAHLHFKSFNKSTGLKTLLNRLNLEDKKIIAFGNHYNDIELLELAKSSSGFGYSINGYNDLVKSSASYDIRSETAMESIYWAFYHLLDKLDC